MENNAENKQLNIGAVSNCKWLLAKQVPMVVYFKCKDSTGWTNTSTKEDAMIFDTKEDAAAFNDWELYNEFYPVIL